MIRIKEFKIKALENTDTLPAKIERRLHLPSGSVKSFSIAKESIDARKKPEVFKVYNLDIETELGDEKMQVNGLETTLEEAKAEQTV